MILYMRVFVIVMSCKKYDGNILENLWLKKSGYEYAVMTANPVQEDDYVWNEQTRRLSVKARDDYDGLPFKMCQGFKFINSVIKPDILIKSDDNVIVNTDLLDTIICRMVKNGSNYLGKLVDVSTRPYIAFGCERFELNNRGPVLMNHDYCGGPLYILDAKSISILSCHMDPSDNRYEDANVGKTLYGKVILENYPNIYDSSLSLFVSGGCVGFTQ